MSEDYPKHDDRGLYWKVFESDKNPNTPHPEDTPPLDETHETAPLRYPYLQPAQPPDVLGADLKNDKLEVKDLAIEHGGRGLYARKKIETGEHVFEFDGIRMGWKKGQLPAREGSAIHGVVVGHDRESSGYAVYAIPNKSSPLRYINHSCDPNTARVPGDPFGFVALREIAPGEQITTDYSLLESNPYWTLDNKDEICKCGADNCRRTIGDASSLPAEYLVQHWARLPSQMQLLAIQYSRDPKIAKIRNTLGTDKIFENNGPFSYLREKHTYEEILSSTKPSIVGDRNLIGAEQLAPKFLELMNKDFDKES